MAMDVLETLKKNLAETGKVAAEKARILKDILVTREQIRSSNKEIRTLTYKIGQTYMELHGEDFEEEFTDYFRGIAEAKSMIGDNEEKLAVLKTMIKPEEAAEVAAEIVDEDIIVDAEDVLAEVAETVEEVAEEAAEAVEEVAEEAAEAVEEVAEEAVEAVEEATEE